MFIVIVAALLAYGQVVNFTLGRFDEEGMILNNLTVLKDSATISDVVRQDPFFRDPGLNFYRPVQNISLLMDAKIGKGKSSTFHSTNLLLHVLTSIMVLLVLTRFSNNKLISLLLALIYAVHPLFAQAIGWVPGRGDLIVALCAAVMLHATLRDPLLASIRTVLTVILASAVAVFAKETAILLPLMFVATLLITPERTAWKNRNFILALLGSIVSGALYLYARSIVVQKTTPGNKFGLETLIENLRVVPEIIAKFIIPIGLQPMASYTLVTTVIGCILCIALGVFIVRITDRDKKLAALFGVAWFLLFTLPGAMFHHADGIAAYDYLEHRAYLPMIGLLTTFSVLLSDYIQPLRWNRAASIVSLVVVAYLITAVFHARNFATPLAFYDKAVSSNQTSSLAHTNRGLIRERNGDMAGAMEDYSAAIQYNPTYAQAYVNRGNRFAATGDRERAKEDYLNAIRFKPTLFAARFNLGNYYIDNHQLDSAYLQYSKAAELNPTFAQAHAMMGVVASLQGNNSKADIHLSEALRIDSQNAQNWLARGKVRFGLGNLREARSDWQRSADLGNAEAPQLLQQYPQR